MSLSEDDVQLIGRMLDQRLERVEADARRRRRRIWLVIVVLTVLSSIASAVAMRRMMVQVEGWLSEQDRQLSDAKIAYQRELRRNEDMQRERAAAVAASGYKPEQSQAEYEAGLMRSLFQLMGKQ